MQISDIRNPWRDKYQQATFRGVPFFVETDARQGGRRIAMHEYPKRNVPYAEDMGKSANKFSVQGYLIGPDYLGMKDDLVDALEANGPGLLRLPLPYQMQDVMVMAGSYSVTESRERGGICMVEMSFVEYGDPAYRQTSATPAQVNSSAQKVDEAVTGTPTPQTQNEVAPYTAVWTILQ